ncbi:phosphoenolpyruvate carboxylase [Pseudohongiella spirulinae]|uniref:Phosphoenolpyruvate carboxylase n=1 Tax=Pseudohongiella spirulinae TaxID=1249552 RepID=A0A0S2KB55_9GAMM|nr:phosphoenolpyruvate carboxylase [Pseudohongiella spirulinae]ALO45528.1 Phosphoenolpyruvate carboxylase [Pseudohongiella spirulinae]
MSNETARLFEELVALNYQLYSSLFLKLPLDAIEQTGTLLPLLSEACERGLSEGKNAKSIIGEFFEQHREHFNEHEQIQFLFKIIQYVERQVVLIDALEDAAYSRIHQIDNKTSLIRLTERAADDGRTDKLAQLLKNFGVRVVLTAHPTQFYPGQVLAIISDLTEAISGARTGEVRDLLQQLGNTPFFQKQKPSPYDEAVLLTWYLSNIFYQAIGELVDPLAQRFPEQINSNAELVSIGFWPGGDRDGNPFVTTDTTLRVAARLRQSIIQCYHNDIRQLKRRLSFRDVYEALDKLEKQLRDELSEKPGREGVLLSDIHLVLDQVERLLSERYQSMYIDSLQSFRRKVTLFGFHFASIDIRQDSRVIARTLESIVQQQPGLLPMDFNSLNEDQQINAMLACKGEVDASRFDDPVIRDTIESFSVIRRIQFTNGERGAHRYIISNCRGPVDVVRVLTLFRLCGWRDRPINVDIVPLFETIDDLQRAGESMARLYANTQYQVHLSHRRQRQTVMLGFSDGTKDGGYLMANWGIYTAKEDVTAVSRDQGVEVIFFDGRGGPPARGGGDTYLFYAAHGRTIESNQIQMTVQGQTISSYYGIKDAAKHNLGQLLTAGLENNLLDRVDRELDDLQRNLIRDLAERSYQKYEAFKNHKLFMPYLEEMSTLKYYAMANIGSRPSKRGGGDAMKFEDLRAIPFVGAWSQLKQNVPGFYGLGSALKAQEELGRLDACLELYEHSRFFRALISNSMQSMSKTNFELTRYMENDPQFGEFWQDIYQEYLISKEMVLKISGQDQLLQDNPRSRMSIRLREEVVLPLLTIQQYALIRIRECREQDAAEQLAMYEKMVVRTLFGNINAARNSA